MAFTIFVENDFVRVIKYLEINPQQSQGEEFVRLQMESTESAYPSLVPTIQADLTKLDTLELALTTERQSAQNALIQADVLRWSDRSGARTEGMIAEFSRIKRRVSQMLGLEPESMPGCMGSLMRG